MSSACYVCAALGATKTVSAVEGTINEPLGACRICHIFACGHHALRCTNPKEYQCVLCIPAWIARSGPGHGAPPTPGAPYESLEQFLNAYPDMDAELVGAIRQAVEELSPRRGKRWDEATRAVAAQAFV